MPPAALLKRVLGTGVSCEFCEISKNTFFYRTPPDDCFCVNKKKKGFIFVLLQKKNIAYENIVNQNSNFLIFFQF